LPSFSVVRPGISVRALMDLEDLGGASSWVLHWHHDIVPNRRRTHHSNGRTVRQEKGIDLDLRACNASWRRTELSNVTPAVCHRYDTKFSDPRESPGRWTTEPRARIPDKNEVHTSSPSGCCCVHPYRRSGWDHESWLRCVRQQDGP
jgi:hypothetical protein